MVRTLLLSIFILSYSLAQAQIPNPSLDHWSMFNGEVTGPSRWKMNYSDSIMPYKDAQDGPNACLMKPVLRNGKMRPSKISASFGLENNDPALFSAYVKTDIPNQDTVSIRVKLYDNGSLTANEEWTTTQTINAYQRVDLTFDGVSSDSAEIVIQSGAMNNPDPETTFIVDNLAFDASVGIQNSRATEQIKAFPNPASETLKVKGLRSSNSYQYQLYNNLGQVAKTGTLQRQNPKINLEGLSKGVYQLFLENENNGAVKSTKVIKQ